MLKNVLKSIFGKAALATAILGGALCFAGAPNAQANEIVVYRGPVVHRYYGPVRYHRDFYVRGWRDRFGCWHRY